jgi:hypothetical protein
MEEPSPRPLLMTAHVMKVAQSVQCAVQVSRARSWLVSHDVLQGWYNCSNGRQVLSLAIVPLISAQLPRIRHGFYHKARGMRKAGCLPSLPESQLMLLGAYSEFFSWGFAHDHQKENFHGHSPKILNNNKIQALSFRHTAHNASK